MSTRSRLLAVFLTGAVIIGALALVASEDPGAQTVISRGTTPAEPVALRIGSPLPVHAIAPGFVGLSLEYTAVPSYAGTANGLDPVFLQLVRNLDPGQRPVLRIGGDTTDWSWVRVPGMPRPAGIRNTIGAGWLRTTGALARALHARLILGIDLEANSRRLAAVEARALLSAVGRSSVQALEVGNEPELYGNWGWYTSRSGKRVFGRAASYDLRSYAAQFSSFARVLPKVPLAGPASADSAWFDHVQPLLRAPRLALVTVHRYPLRACDTPAASTESPTIAHLLSSPASNGLAASVVPAVRIARARGLPLRVDELNSVACRGKRGVSNTFASALWVLNTLFAMARAGVQGVNIHTLPGSRYQPFMLGRVRGAWRGVVEPEYYGMLMFTKAAPPGSRLLAVSGAAGSGVLAWATRTPSGQIKLVLINDGSGDSRYVAVRAPDPSGSAVLARLRAPSAHATRGVALEGQGFGLQTATGLLVGRERRSLLAPVAGEYAVRLPPASAAMLTLAPAR